MRGREGIAHPERVSPGQLHFDPVAQLCSDRALGCSEGDGGAGPSGSPWGPPLLMSLESHSAKNPTCCGKFLLLMKTKHTRLGDFPGCPVVKTSPFNARGMGSIPVQGAQIPHASLPKHQNIKPKQYCNTFSKEFKRMVCIQFFFFLEKALILNSNCVVASVGAQWGASSSPWASVCSSQGSQEMQ